MLGVAPSIGRAARGLAVVAATAASFAAAGDPARRIGVREFMAGAPPVDLGVSFELPVGYRAASDLMRGPFVVWADRDELAASLGKGVPSGGALIGRLEPYGRSAFLACGYGGEFLRGAPEFAARGVDFERREANGVTLLTVDAPAPPPADAVVRRVRAITLASPRAPGVFTLSFMAAGDADVDAARWRSLVESFSAAPGVLSWPGSVDRPPLMPVGAQAWTILERSGLLEGHTFKSQRKMLDLGVGSVTVVQPVVKGAIKPADRFAVASVDTGPGVPLESVCDLHQHATAALVGPRYVAFRAEDMAEFLVSIALHEAAVGAQAELTLVALVSATDESRGAGGGLVGFYVAMRRYAPVAELAGRMAQRMALAREMLSDAASAIPLATY